MKSIARNNGDGTIFGGQTVTLKTSKYGMLLEAFDEPGLSSPGLYLQNVNAVLDRISVPEIEEVVATFFRAYLQGRALYIFGNGGSAALASHTACDLGKGTAINGNKRLRVISLTDNVALITALANDVAYEDIFAAQLQPLIEPGDVAFAISGSGNSPNVLKALAVAREAGGISIGLTGFQGGRMRALCDACIIVPSEHMQQIEDAHVCIMHSVFLALRQLVTTAHRAVNPYLDEAERDAISSRGREPKKKERIV
jgi:D-sedoheptulose 7-phosphate isomerase